MIDEESIEVRQKNELQVLKSIYGKDLKDLRKKRQCNPLHFALTLTPLQSSSGLGANHVRIDMVIKCDENYPNKEPEINLVNPRGLAINKVDDLRTQLEQLSRSYVGEVMIYQLAQHVQEFLYENNKPQMESCYEEMMRRQQKILKEKFEAAKLEGDREVRVALINDIQHRQEILEREQLSFRIKRGSLESGDNNFITKKDCIAFENNIKTEIRLGQRLDSNNANCTNYTGIDSITGKLYKISEWLFDDSMENSAHITKTLQSIDQEFAFLITLQHKNLRHYIDIHCSRHEHEIKVYILQEFPFGCACYPLYENIHIEVNTLRFVAESVLHALDYLHQHNVTHKGLAADNTYLTNEGVVKVSNFSIETRLNDLLAHKLHSYDKSHDIYMLGTLLLRLIRSFDDKRNTHDLPNHLPMSAKDFLERCLNQERLGEWSARMLLNHSFIKQPIVQEMTIVQQNINAVTKDDDEQQHLEMLTHSSDGQSRFESEFDLLSCLGKGAYGDVFKVQNRLDQGYYAIKRIQLNPRNRQLNKKIIREVKLLSRLNHENVVRYYNSWIETATLPMQEDDDTSSPTKTSGVDSLDDPLIKRLSMEWSISYGNKSKTNEPKTSTSSTSSLSNDDDDDDDEDWRIESMKENSDDLIAFEHSNANGDDDDDDDNDDEEDSREESTVEMRAEIQYMYIQMEFCEKSTLRIAIDDGLYLNTNRVWRLFREIVEGLAHIHQQGMIHRDLKPMNIFLDLNDNVKIGDFGLATSNFLGKSHDAHKLNKKFYENKVQIEDASMTGHIGTALYVAPELTSASKAIYNEKVDIYSLGVIFFEMTYKPLQTGMERIAVLNALRSNEITLPDDFFEFATISHEYIIKWLLNHDKSKRPTSLELLESDHIPAPVLEERELQEMVRHTLRNPHLKAYKYLVDACFKQSISLAADITYDKEVGNWKNEQYLRIFSYLEEAIVDVFKMHGGHNLTTPLLLPKTKYYDGVDACVKLMTNSGCVVSLPYDLRLSFARYVVKNGITSLRRYSIERVYRERRVFGFSPRELYECAFDIITPNLNFMADAEILFILKQVIEQVPSLKTKTILLKLNHVQLLKAILLHCKIREKHNEIFNVLAANTREGKLSKANLSSYLINYGLSSNSIKSLFTYLDLEFHINDIPLLIEGILNQNQSECGDLAKQAICDLKEIIKHAKDLGLEYNCLIIPGLVFDNVQQYSGMICQLVCEIKRKHKSAMEVLAAGGRYDNTINNYKQMMVQANLISVDIKQCAVGISISLDKLIQAMYKETTDDMKLINLDAAVCSLGNNRYVTEKLQILRDLWNAGLKCILIEANNMADIHLQSHEMNLPHVILLRYPGDCKIISHEKDRFQEKEVSRVDLVETMQRLITKGDNEQKIDTKIYQDSNIDMVFMYTFAGEKFPPHQKKRIENLIRCQLQDLCKKVNGQITIVLLNITGAMIKTISAYLDFDSKERFYESLDAIRQRDQKFKKSLDEIFHELYTLKCIKNKNIVLYSISDNLYKILL